MTEQHTMQAVTLSGTGEPEVLKLSEIERAKIQSSTDVLINLKAAAVNPLDTKLRSGKYPVDPLPSILGCDGSGIVSEIGSAVTDLAVGDEVYFFHGGISGIPGNYAEYIALDQRFVALKPTSLSFVEAAAAPLVLITAWESLFDRANVQKDNTVLIHAGAGGVGHVAIQLAKHVGAKVATTVSTREKAEFVTKLGADKVIFYKDENFVDSIMEWTDGNGVDMVMDNIGGSLLEQSFPAVKVYGDIVSLLIADPKTDWSVARVRNLRFSHEVMITPLALNLIEAQMHQTQILNDCALLFEQGKLRVHVSETFPLEQAAAAHRLIEQGSSNGKIVLSIT